jgi:NAD(P)-dependent dehydrogenase (short-subunit alcohol dehydrogenase family)
MRARSKGTIINISSLAGITAMAGVGYYSASKFALEGLTEALSQEVAPLGIKVLSIEPGGFRTGILERHAQPPYRCLCAYRACADAVAGK